MSKRRRPQRLIRGHVPAPLRHLIRKITPRRDAVDSAMPSISRRPRRRPPNPKPAPQGPACRQLQLKGGTKTASALFPWNGKGASAAKTGRKRGTSEHLVIGLGSNPVHTRSSRGQSKGTSTQQHALRRERERRRASCRLPIPLRSFTPTSRPWPPSGRRHPMLRASRSQAARSSPRDPCQARHPRRQLRRSSLSRAPGIR